jgi:hypothetical protein
MKIKQTPSLKLKKGCTYISLNLKEFFAFSSTFVDDFFNSNSLSGCLFSKFLLALASTVVLDSEILRTHDHILLSYVSGSRVALPLHHQ